MADMFGNTFLPGEPPTLDPPSGQALDFGDAPYNFGDFGRSVQNLQNAVAVAKPHVAEGTLTDEGVQALASGAASAAQDAIDRTKSGADAEAQGKKAAAAAAAPVADAAPAEDAAQSQSGAKAAETEAIADEKSAEADKARAAQEAALAQMAAMQQSAK